MLLEIFASLRIECTALFASYLVLNIPPSRCLCKFPSHQSPSAITSQVTFVWCFSVNPENLFLVLSRKLQGSSSLCSRVLCFMLLSPVMVPCSHLPHLIHQQRTPRAQKSQGGNNPVEQDLKWQNALL